MVWCKYEEAFLIQSSKESRQEFYYYKFAKKLYTKKVTEDDYRIEWGEPYRVVRTDEFIFIVKSYDDVIKFREGRRGDATHIFGINRFSLKGHKHEPYVFGKKLEVYPYDCEIKDAEFYNCAIENSKKVLDGLKQI